MKILRITAFIAVIVILCSFASSIQPPRKTLPTDILRYDATGYVVRRPMKYPDYTFDSKPSKYTLRQTAVRATRDLLSVQWSTAKDITYHKSGPVNHKKFFHEADTTYAGTPYSNGSTGLFQFLEYYDQQTGRLWYPGTGVELSRHLGNSCADSVLWGYSTVCTSIKGGYYPSAMVYQNGYYPVGSYTYDYSITTFSKLPTTVIVKENGKDIMMDSYRMVLPGDSLVSSSVNHTMMVIETPHISLNSDGSINSAKSYVMIQDQRGGHGAGFYEQDKYGKIILYSGRTRAKCTFDELYKKNYIPVTVAEFMGIKEYETAFVTASTEKCSTLESLKEVTVSSNYPLAVINVILTDSNGDQKTLEKVLFSGANDGPSKEFDLADLTCLDSYIRDKHPQKDYSVSIEVVVSTGERFTPVILTF